MEPKDKKTQWVEMRMRGRGGWCKTAECLGVNGRQLLVGVNGGQLLVGVNGGQLLVGVDCDLEE